MPVKLNLLPPELSVSKSLGTILKTFRILGVIGIAAFLIFSVGTLIIFVINTINLNGLNANVAKLKSQVSTQEKSEQQVVLLKDRLAKITTVQKMPSAIPNLVSIEPFLTGLSGDVSVSQIIIDPKSVDLAANIKTISGLTSFLQFFKTPGAFKSVNLASFGFSSKSGYSVEVNAVTK
jgi:hypothetical protein